MKKIFAIATLIMLSLVGAAIGVTAIGSEQSYAASVTVNPVVSVTITTCGDLSFGNVNHNSNDNPVSCQAGSGYAVNVENTASSNTNIDVETKGTEDFTGDTGTIPLGNAGWTEINNATSETAMTTDYVEVQAGVSPSASVNLFYWLDVPNMQTAGDYGTTFYVQGS